MTTASSPDHRLRLLGLSGLLLAVASFAIPATGLAAASSAGATKASVAGTTSKSRAQVKNRIGHATSLSQHVTIQQTQVCTRSRPPARRRLSLPLCLAPRGRRASRLRVTARCARASRGSAAGRAQASRFRAAPAAELS